MSHLNKLPLSLKNKLHYYLWKFRFLHKYMKEGIHEHIGFFDLETAVLSHFLSVTWQRHTITSSCQMSTWCLSGQLKFIPVEVYMLLWVLDWHDHIHSCALSCEGAAASVSSPLCNYPVTGTNHGPHTLQSRYLPTCVNTCGVCFLYLEWLSDLYKIMWKNTILLLHIRSLRRTDLDCDRTPQLFSLFSLFLHQWHVALTRSKQFNSNTYFSNILKSGFH